MLVDFAGQARRGHEKRERESEGNRQRETVQVAPIEATACGIVPGLRGLELQTNAITPHPMPPYTDRIVSRHWTRIHRSTIEPLISVSPTRFHSTGGLALFMLRTFPSWQVCGVGILARHFSTLSPRPLNRATLRHAAQFRKYVETRTYVLPRPFRTVVNAF